MLICIALLLANMAVGPLGDISTQTPPIYADDSVHSVKSAKVAHLSSVDAPTTHAAHVVHATHAAHYHAFPLIFDKISSKNPDALLNYLKDYASHGLNPSDLDIVNEHESFPLDVAFSTNQMAMIDILIGFNFRFMKLTHDEMNEWNQDWLTLIHKMVSQQAQLTRHYGQHSTFTPYWHLKINKIKTFWRDAMDYGILEYTALFNPFDFEYLLKRHSFDSDELEYCLALIKQILLKLKPSANKVDKLNLNQQFIRMDFMAISLECVRKQYGIELFHILKQIQMDQPENLINILRIDLNSYGFDWYSEKGLGDLSKLYLRGSFTLTRDIFYRMSVDILMDYCIYTRKIYIIWT
eukprot:NODE_279_length_10886_cov_0.340039.p2 type:complete len:352 gc:universal NODE_279_length_10886_cov_0.340039:6918-5863(-)